MNNEMPGPKPMSGFTIVMISFGATLVLGLFIGVVIYMIWRFQQPAGVAPTSTQSMVQTGEMDDSNPAINYFGTWETLTDIAQALNGTLRRSTVVGQTALIEFDGQSVSITYATSPQGGIMDVTIDGIIVADIDQNTPTPTWENIWQSLPLKTGHHTLVLTHASGDSVNVDAINIQTEQTATPSPTITLIGTPTKTPMPLPTIIVSGTPMTVTSTASKTPAPLSTIIVSGTPMTVTPTRTATVSGTPSTKTITKTPTTYKTATKTRTRTPTRTRTRTPTRTKTKTRTPTPLPSSTKTLANTSTMSPTPVTPSATFTATLPSVSGYAIRLRSDGTYPNDAVIIQVDPILESSYLDATKDFTIEFWFRAAGTLSTSKDKYIMDHHNVGVPDSPGVWSHFYDYSTVPPVGLQVGGGIQLQGSNPSYPTSYTVNTSTTVNDNYWHHYALVRSIFGASLYTGPTLCVYLDGTGRDCLQQAAINNDLRPGTTPLYILGSTSDTTKAVDIFIDELRISNTVRPNYGGVSFTPPSARFTTDSNTVMLFHFDEGYGSAVTGSCGISGGPASINGTLVKGFSSLGAVISPFDTAVPADAQHLTDMWVNDQFPPPSP